MEWIVDDISEVLSAADVKQILHKFYHEGKGSDPIIHFYETFLTEYDPQTREKEACITRLSLLSLTLSALWITS